MTTGLKIDTKKRKFVTFQRQCENIIRGLDRKGFLNKVWKNTDLEGKDLMWLL